MDQQQLSPIQVEGMILSMYTATDQQKREEAIQWLHNFSESQNAWQAILALITSSKHKEVQFFASNMLYTKLQKEWLTQNDQFKDEMLERIGQLLGAYIYDSQVEIARNAMQRICLAYATIAVLSPTIVQSYVVKVKELFQTVATVNGNAIEGEKKIEKNQRNRSSSPEPLLDTSRNRAVFLCSELLMILPEEKDSSNLPKRAEASALEPGSIENMLRSVLPEVLRIIDVMLLASREAKDRVFTCVQSWAPLGISFTVLFGSWRRIYDALLEGLSLSTCEIVEAASNALVSIINLPSPSLQLQGSLSEDELLVVKQTAFYMNETCRQSLKTALQKGDDTIALAICRCLTTFAETHCSLLVEGASSEMNGLADTILDCTKYPKREVSGVTLDFWLAVQDIPMNQRHESFRDPCYHALLEILVKQCSIDKGSLDPMDMNYDIVSYRQVAKDVFVSVFFVLRSHFFQELLNMVNEATLQHSWIEFESTLFAMDAVAIEAISFLKDTESSGPEATPVREAIIMLILQISSNALIQSNSLTIITAARISGDYSKLLPALNLYYQYHQKEQPKKLLYECVRLCLNGLHIPDARVVCSNSLKKVCLACPKELAKLPEILEMIILTLERSINSGLEAEGRGEILQGLIRIASSFENPQESQSLLANIINPSIKRLLYALSKVNENISASSNTIGNELKAFQTCVQFSHGYPVAGLMQELWPSIESIFSNEELMIDSFVGESLFGVLSAAMLVAPEIMADKTGGILNACITHYRRTHMSYCLSCIAKSVEVYGKNPSPFNQGAFADVLHQVCIITYELVEKRETVEHPDIVENFFSMIYVFFLFSSSILIQSSEFEKLFKLAIYSMSMQESAPLKSVLLFIEKVIVKCKDIADLAAQQKVVNTINAQGEYLSSQIVACLARLSPSAHLSKVGSILLQLLKYDENKARTWLMKALFADHCVTQKLSHQEISGFFNVICDRIGNDIIFDDCIVDFAKYCRGELSLQEVKVHLR